MNDLIFRITLKLSSIVNTLSEDEYKKQIHKFNEVEKMLEELNNEISVLIKLHDTHVKEVKEINKTLDEIIKEIGNEV